MKAIILTPTFFPRLTGNAVTAGRISRELTEGGVECLVIDLSVVGEAEVQETTRKFGPDLVHGFHAYKSGRIGLAIKERLGVPMITTLTGTDLYSDLKTQGKREAVLRVLAKSDRMTVFNDSARRRLIREGISPQKIAVIHQSAFFPERGERDFRSELHIDRRTKVCLLMGGIRRIKNFGYAFSVLERVRENFPDLCLLIAGGVLEEEEFRRLKRRGRGRPWIRFLGEVPRNDIPSLLSCVDIVLNTSDSESEANAILEALSFGKVVVGRHISGNRSLLDGRTGFLFRNRKELYELILRLLRDRKEAIRTGRRARGFVASRFRRDRERMDYLYLYRETVDPGFCRSSRSLDHPISSSGAASIGTGSGKTRSTSE